VSGAAHNQTVAMIQAVLFDLDGTLVDSNEWHVTAWQRAFHHFGREFSREQLHAHIGKGADQYLPALLTKEELRKFGKQVDEYRSELFQKEFLPLVRPFPKVQELFERLRRDRKRIALATSGKKKELDHYKKIAGIEKLVDCETSADDADHSKPAPDVFAASLDKLGDPDPRTVLAVGDTPYDSEGAGKIGIATIGVLCGGFSEAELHKAGMIAIYRDPADILEHYEDSPLAAGIMPA
jgi:HAD superfamily hydrolase (TIGR01549 family)